MNKEIIVNVGERETRIAVTEDGKLVELDIERNERVVGSIYKCRVANVLPGMDAAFVDIGLERNAYLSVADVIPADAEGAARPGSASDTDSATTPGPPALDADGASIHEPDAVRGTRASESISDDEPALYELNDAAGYPDPGRANGYLGAGAPRQDRPRRNTRRSVLRQQNIKDVLSVGQELLVQVIKGPRSTKGARVSTRITLPGRYIVLMPDGGQVGVSRKIEHAGERDRLRLIGDKLRPEDFGLIIRTEAEDKTEQELRQDMQFLLRTWRQVQDTARKARAPALVQQDLTLLFKTIRDVFGSDVSKLVIDDAIAYERANELLDRISPRLKGRVLLYSGLAPVFDHYGLEAEIERLSRRKVYLRSGGSLVIEETEALTAIDVNTSKFTGGSSLAETILKTNVDAAAEIARQLRLRDIGGIIVIDFIDMTSAREKQAVMKALENALRKDRSRTKISNISPLGLVEMTRKRTGETLTGLMTDECPYCNGRGHLPSAESVSIKIERDLDRQARLPQNAGVEAFLIKCHPEVAELLIGLEGAAIEQTERELQRAIFVRADEDAHLEKFSIDSGTIAELENKRLGFRRSEVVECHITRSLVKDPNKCVGWTSGYLVDLDDGIKAVGQTARVRLRGIKRSCGLGELVESR